MPTALSTKSNITDATTQRYYSGNEEIGIGTGKEFVVMYTLSAVQSGVCDLVV